jgi:hypothetical protein
MKLATKRQMLLLKVPFFSLLQLCFVPLRHSRHRIPSFPTFQPTATWQPVPRIERPWPWHRNDLFPPAGQSLISRLHYSSLCLLDEQREFLLLAADHYCMLGRHYAESDSGGASSPTRRQDSHLVGGMAARQQGLAESLFLYETHVWLTVRSSMTNGGNK